MNDNESCRYIFKTKKILTTPCIIFKCLMYTKKIWTYSRKETIVIRIVQDVGGDLLSIPRHHTSNYKH